MLILLSLVLFLSVSCGPDYSTYYYWLLSQQKQDKEEEIPEVSVWDGSVTDYEEIGQALESGSFFIRSASDFAALRDIVNGKAADFEYDWTDTINAVVTLETDLVLSAFDWEPIGDMNIIYMFTGEFDGNDHSIAYRITSDQKENSAGAGLFECIGTYPGQSDLYIHDLSITAEINVADVPPYSYS